MELLGSAAEYEAFIEDRLKVDLKMIEEQTEKLLRQLSDYVNLKNNLLAIERNHLKKLSTLIDIGGFYVKTKIPDTSHVFVNVGLGFHVEFTLQEALAFIELKETHLAGYVL
jgi:prefoldin subunit 5